MTISKNQNLNPNNTFFGVADYYEKYRPKYPKELFNLLKEIFQLSKNESVVLDLGCATGQVAIDISNDAKNVYAVDPQIDMLSIGRENAKKKNISNIEWYFSNSDDIKHIKDTLTLTTIARAFHWMNREQVLNDLYKITKIGGGVAIIGDSSFLRKKEPWEIIVKEIIKKWLGKERKAGTDGTYSHPTKLHDEVLKESQFKNFNYHQIKFKREWTLDQIIGYQYTTSFCSIPILGDKKEGFEKDLRNALLSYNPSGIFEENTTLSIMTVHKK